MPSNRKLKQLNPEKQRLLESQQGIREWKHWGPYLSERQWGTVREDYSPNGDAWNSFPHDHARSRTYRWGEDGLLGITDRRCRLCFALTLWNERDPILKERLFGLSNPEGNHGEDVKELYYYLDSTPTHSYMKSLYKYPQATFPYEDLINENRKRGLADPEYEILDTGVFDGNRYFDVFAEYAKAAPDDILIRITVWNRGPSAAKLHLLPTLWFRNTWIWGAHHDDYVPRPRIERVGETCLRTTHARMEDYLFECETPGQFLFTENETNTRRLYGTPNCTEYTKDAFHRKVIAGEDGAVNPESQGTKAAVWYILDVPAEGRQEIRLRLRPAAEAKGKAFGRDFENCFRQRMEEADLFYRDLLPGKLNQEERRVLRQAYAGLLHTKQFYYYSVKEWLEGDSEMPKPPKERLRGRNSDWHHVFCRDVISMPDKWEYPWFAAWDLAFHMIPFDKIDPEFSKRQLILLLREWYMHPNGQIPAYEWNFSDVNPPVHAWAVWRVYKMTARKGERDVDFLAQCFHKLLINFTWWVNRKDPDGRNLFSGGFLGLDNIGAFDRSKPLPGGAQLEQADGTAWMAFYCATMLSIALELASVDPSYEGVASKFFEHFISIADAINTLGGTGLWNERDGFYYDQIELNRQIRVPVTIRSMVGLLPLCAVEILRMDVIDKLPRFKKRMQWYLRHSKLFSDNISCLEYGGETGCEAKMLLAIPSRQRLERVLRYVFDEKEFLSPYGLRSLSLYHKENPYVLSYGGKDYVVKYVPGASDSTLFGGNSNWRGPVWFPLNYILMESLEKYHHYYGDSLKVELPTGSGNWVNLDEAACEISRRLINLFLPDKNGERPIHGHHAKHYRDPHFRDLVLFYEYFDGDSGRGVGASHQTGWTGLVAKLLEDRAHRG